MPSPNQLSGGHFQDALGNPIAGGYLTLELSQDAQVNGNTGIAAGYTIKINLDSQGNVIQSPSQAVWPNDVLSPVGTFYNVSAFTAEGQRVWGPNPQQVLSYPSPFDIGTWTPSSVNVGLGAPQSPVLPGAQYQIPLYGVEGAVVSATNLTSDATKSNLNVPNLATVGQLTSATTKAFPTGSTASADYNYVQNSTNLTAEGAGFSLGNSGGWSVKGGDYLQFNSAQRGIDQSHSFVLNKHAVGDTAGLYGYVYTDGGASAQSDEGATGLTVQQYENTGYFHGTVSATSGTGDQSPTWSFTSGNNWTTDGAFMLNISKGSVSGNVVAASNPLTLTITSGSVSTFLNYLPVTSNALPISTAIGVTVLSNGAIPNPGVTANHPVPCTFTVNLAKIGGITKLFTVGSVVTVAGNWYPEQSIITAAVDHGDGTQTLTMNLRNPNDSAIVFQGGIQGTYISFDANLAFSGYRSSYYAFGSLTGSDLIYGYNVEGGVANNLLPQMQAEAATNDGGADSGFHLYPGAEVVCNPAYNSASGTLEQNGVQWSVGDVVENPHYPVYAGTGLWVVRQQHTPTNFQAAAVGLFVQHGGTGFGGGNTVLARMENTNPKTYYIGNGGPLLGPVAMTLTGSFVRHIYIDSAPEPDGNLIQLEYPNNASQPNNIVSLIRITYANGSLTFNPTGNVWSFGDKVDAKSYSVNGSNGASGSFTTADSKTVTVVNGLITSIV